MNVPSDHTDLSKFQTRILTILADAPGHLHGLGIKDALEEYYGKEINHGRLYPNLDSLVDAGYVEKGEIDRRTNSYELTEAGRVEIASELAWLVERVDGFEPDDETDENITPETRPGTEQEA